MIPLHNDTQLTEKASLLCKTNIVGNAVGFNNQSCPEAMRSGWNIKIKAAQSIINKTHVK